MSLLATMLYPERFIPPVGLLRSFVDKSNPQQDHIDDIKERVYNLVIDGFDLDTDIASELGRSPGGIRIYLKMLIADSRIKRIDLPKQKSRYFEISKQVDISQFITNPKKRTRRSTGSTTRSKEVRAEYVRIINSGVNTSSLIAKVRGQTTSGTLATLFRMEKSGVIKQIGKGPGTGLGSAPIIWEVI